MDNSRRKMIKRTALLFATIFAGSAINKIDAVNNSITPQKTRVARKALFIEKNCIVSKQAQLIKEKKKVEKEECNACVTACPVKAIETKEIEGAKGFKIPTLIEEKCIGCTRCLRVCPQDPKAWEIWDKTNNKKLM